LARTSPTHAANYTRVNGRVDQRHDDDAHWPSVRVLEHATGIVRHLTAEEDAAFWEWAYVEVLRHTGARRWDGRRGRRAAAASRWDDWRAPPPAHLKPFKRSTHDNVTRPRVLSWKRSHDMLSALSGSPPTDSVPEPIPFTPGACTGRIGVPAAG
jgi:hypothetical protein